MIQGLTIILSSIFSLDGRRLMKPSLVFASTVFYFFVVFNLICNVSICVIVSNMTYLKYILRMMNLSFMATNFIAYILNEEETFTIPFNKVITF